MEIPALYYFSCWSLIAITSIKLGFIALERENTIISPLIIFVLKRFLAVCVCHSSTYALVHRSGVSNTSLLNHFKLSILGFSFLFYLSLSTHPTPLRFVLCYAFFITTTISLLITTVDSGLVVDFVVRSIVFSLEVQNDAVFPIFVLVAAFFTAGLAAIFDGISLDQKRSDRGIIRPVQTYSKKRKIVQFTTSILASVVFQMLVRLESLSHVVTFLCFAIAWLGCIALTMDRLELGLFDLLVCNVLIGCTNRFGLFGPTWLAFAASVVLFVLHPKLKTVRFVRDRDVVLW